MGNWLKICSLLLLQTTLFSAVTARATGVDDDVGPPFLNIEDVVDALQADFPYLAPADVSLHIPDHIFYSPTVVELQRHIESTPGWKEAFETAINDSVSTGIEFQGVHDIPSLLDYLTRLLVWMPSEVEDGKFMYDKFALLGFLFDHPSIIALPDAQNPIAPSQFKKPKRYLTEWLIRYNRSLGAWLGSPESISPETVETFRSAPKFNMDDYIEPEGGWATFNDFFARHVKPEKRPIAGIDDPCIIIQPADSVFDGAWPISSNKEVTIKGVPWPIQELFNGSKYVDKFKDGLFTHSFLNINDYHRQHAPVSGKIVEVQNIDGYAYAIASVANPAGVEAADSSDSPDSSESSDEDLELFGSGKGNRGRSRSGLAEEGFPDHDKSGKPELTVKRRLQLDDEAGFQFLQLRGLIVIEATELGGYVAILPIGMGQCSSVMITVKEGDDVKKGDEISYFQFGGSDVVMIFSKDMNVQMTAQEGTHYLMGEAIAKAVPVVVPS
ncbi:hypothetical protein BJ508DRAFT_19561 [Ascobolus immersus RN42]|uniref:Phosphatidylserine decarboxylase n=1 Tax=Ascobolus immersus RN42 TaxID=1160509 RepID=A0A3N4HNQ6_ASCIM|nr:hypothetical protein BJ508DRAFT_19561 [Ascobolus immersus RN42]